MNESSAPIQNPLAQTGGLGAGTQQYELSDDLARLCLPQEWSDACRTLAWVNSICFLFLVVGLVGLKAPKVIHKPLSEINEPVPVIFTPPEEPPKTEPEVKPDEPDKPQDTTEETPTVAPIVAVMDSPAVAFSVPVQGAVAVAKEARLATPPPPVTHAPTAPTKFVPSVGGGGSHPAPVYPAIALRNHYEGTVFIEFTVDGTGAISSAKVQKSSGFPVLDEAALEVVKNRWRFPPGSPGYWWFPFVFQMQ
jgi:periplasmic protein TonB